MKVEKELMLPNAWILRRNEAASGTGGMVFEEREILWNDMTAKSMSRSMALDTPGLIKRIRSSGY
ncbi:MAG: hypothetical protein HQK58_01280 [Deltaproteobacteria bacterium]|nr:hypothetical protein [Deltaproteobacteria bacterium]